MHEQSVTVNLEINRHTNLEEVFTNLSVVKKLVQDLGKGLEVNDLSELLVQNGLSGNQPVSD